MSGQPVQATAVALGGRALLLVGPPGCGKTSLALELIDRGATLIGDDGVLLRAAGGQVLADPPEATRGLIELRNLGLFTLPVCSAVPVALVLRVDPEAPRFIDAAESITLAGLPIPLLRIWPGMPAAARRAELALDRYGLASAGRSRD
ncbi:MAG: HPr kinase/phosphatase C-terminal domain-containing protein [Proteobacteria bacterium]|nr:HPr kinase/phosphatase C-terminal domain-containing protein [Pseudomonadota bacterium]